MYQQLKQVQVGGEFKKEGIIQSSSQQSYNTKMPC